MVRDLEQENRGIHITQDMCLQEHEEHIIRQNLLHHHRNVQHHFWGVSVGDEVEAGTS